MSETALKNWRLGLISIDERAIVRVVADYVSHHPEIYDGPNNRGWSRYLHSSLVVWFDYEARQAQTLNTLYFLQDPGPKPDEIFLRFSKLIAPKYTSKELLEAVKNGGSYGMDQDALHAATTGHTKALHRRVMQEFPDFDGQDLGSCGIETRDAMSYRMMFGN